MLEQQLDPSARHAVARFGASREEPDQRHFAAALTNEIRKTEQIARYSLRSVIIAVKLMPITNKRTR